MPVLKRRPHIRCRVAPPSAIPTGGNCGFGVAIVLADCIGTSGGTSSGAIAGLPILNPLASRAWDAPTQAASIGEALELVRFSKDGRVTFGASAQDAGGEDEFSGFMLRLVESPLDGRGGADGTNFDLLAGLSQLTWTAIAGAWRGVQHGGEGLARGVVNVGGLGIERAQSGLLSANQGTRWTITGQGMPTAQGVHALRCSVADGLYGVLLPHGKPPRLQKRQNGQYVEWGGLKGASVVDLRSGAVQVLRLFRLAGRLIVGWQGGFWWVAEPLNTTPETDAQNDTRARAEIAWPQGRALVETRGCHVRVDVAALDFDTLASIEKRQMVLDVGALNYAYQGTGEKGIPTGWLKYGSARVDMTSQQNRGFITLTLDGSADRHDTPVVNKVSGKYPDTPYDEGTDIYLDISAAVRGATLELAAPPISNMASLQVTLDRLHLDRISANWGGFLKQFSVIEWEACWEYTDGSSGPWTRFFKGIVAKPDAGTGGVNERHMALTCFDPMYLLKAPAALIDHSYPPLDLFWLLKLRSSNSQTGGSGPYNPIYPPTPGGLPQNVSRLEYSFADAVRDILYLLRGPGAGVLADYTDGLFPLLSSEGDGWGYCRAVQVASGDTQPPTTQGWCLPARQGTDGVGWLQEICDRGSLVCFYGHVPGFLHTDWPRPILSTFDRLLADRPTHLVSDTIFNGLSQNTIAAWVNHVAQSIERESRPDATINHVEATSTGFFGDSNDGAGYPPRIAEAYLPDSDVNSEKNIRHRRSVIKDVGPLGGFPGGVEAYVLEYASHLEINSEYTWPTVSMEGRAYYPAQNDAPIVPGDKLEFAFGSSVESDTGLNLNGRVFRVATATHRWDMGQSVQDWTMDVGTRPLSGTGL